MGWIKRKPPSPRSFLDICPEGLWDVHAHLLPGVDDGPLHLDESIAMVDGLASLGYVAATATPHFHSRHLEPTRATVQQLIHELTTRRADRPPRILTGAEILLDDVFLTEERQGHLPALGTGPVYLVELGFAPGSVPPSLVDILFKFQVGGGNLMLAHPERTPDLQRDVSVFERIYNTGTLLQIDAMSLVGHYGAQAEKTALHLIEEGLADVVGSDLHSSRDLQELARALDRLADWHSDRFVQLVHTNPKHILEGRVDEVVRNA